MCYLVGCTALSVSDGTVDPTSDIISGATATVTCNSGFELADGSTDVTITCTNGAFDSTPTCTATGA